MGSIVVDGLCGSSVGDTGEGGAARWASRPGSAAGVGFTAVVSMVMVGLQDHPSRSVGTARVVGEGEERVREREKAEGRLGTKGRIVTAGACVRGDLFLSWAGRYLDVRSWPPRRWWRVLISVIMA